MGSNRGDIDKAPNVGLDDVTEDIFGLNIKGLRTIWTLFWKPPRVFDAAASPDWAGRYTPSIRIVFSLLAAMALLRFLWVGARSPFTVRATAEFGTAFPNLPPEVIADVTKTFTDVYVSTLPFVAMIAYTIAAASVRVWGGAGLALRIRLFFAALIPNLTQTLAFLPMVALANTNQRVFALAGVAISLAIALDFITSVRGGVKARSIWGKLLKGLLFAGCSFAALILATVVSQLIAQEIAVREHVPAAMRD